MTETKETTKKQLIIFLLVAYGFTYVMGFLAWYGNSVQADLSAFPSAQMFYPAAGVMLAYLLTRRQDDLLPKWFYRCFIGVTFFMALLSVLSVAAPEQTVILYETPVSLWAILTQYVTIIGSILCLIPLWPWLEKLENLLVLYSGFSHTLFRARLCRLCHGRAAGHNAGNL